MTVADRIKEMKSSLPVSEEELAKQKDNIEYILHRINAPEFPRFTESGDIDYIITTGLKPQEKLDYLKKFASRLGGEDALFRFSNAVMEIGKEYPETQPKMYDCLHSFVNYKKVGYDVGLPLNNMYDQLRRNFKDTPNYAENVLRLINTEIYAERFDKMPFNVSGRIQTLGGLLIDNPQFSNRIYDTYQDIIKNHSKDQPDIWGEAYFLGKLTPLIKDEKNSSAIKSKYGELEKKCWEKVTSNKSTIKHTLRKYLFVFPQHAEKAFNEVKDSLNPFYKDDQELLSDFYKAGKKNPDFAKTIKAYNHQLEERARKTADIMYPNYHN